MMESPSKESLVYHESFEQISDSDNVEDPHVSYGSTSYASNPATDHSYLSPPPTSRSPTSQINSSISIYQDVGPKARVGLRKMQKLDRISSRRILETSTRRNGHPKKSFFVALSQMITGNKINLLLLALPLAYWSQHSGWSGMSVFLWNFIAMIPLAALLGAFTEELAAHTNQTIGGLINATFGNAVEVVVAIQALLAGEVRVVQASMIGSIFSNLLLVLGCCFFFGGLIYKEQHYQSMVATANMGLLGLSSIALILPTPFAEYYDLEDEESLGISRVAAIFLIVMYLQLLVFQLKTHADLFEDDEEEETEMSFASAMAGLVGVTAIITKLSEYLVDSIDGFCTESGISRTFVGLIIIPIVGNAVEHATAVSVAMKDKMDLAMGVAVGSCVQISLFVAPITVIVGWVADVPMSFNFPHFEIILYVLSIVIVSICVSNSKSNWLEGSMLITTYVMIAVGFWYEKVRDY
jgi:Ca2+:H+ antiporter